MLRAFTLLHEDALHSFQHCVRSRKPKTALHTQIILHLSEKVHGLKKRCLRRPLLSIVTVIVSEGNSALH